MAVKQASPPPRPVALSAILSTNSLGEKMVYTRRYFIEITTLNPITDDLVFISLERNIKDSYIKLFKIEGEYTLRGLERYE